MRSMAQRRPVLREVPGLDRSVCRAAVVVRSVKLVHQRIESGEAGMSFLAIAPRFDSASIRVEHEPVGTEERPWTGPAVARCLLQHAMVHSARSYTRRNAAFSGLKLPSDPAREVTYSQRSCSHASERPGRKVRHVWEVQLTLEHGSAAHSTGSSGRMARRRLTTVPGTDPVLPAAH